MPEPAEQARAAEPALFAYRRIPPFQWDARTDRPQPAAFRRKPAEDGLSVYRADHCTPRAVLDMMLAGQQEKADATDAAIRERALRWLSRNGSSPELLWERGWRMARLNLDDFIARGLGICPPDADGHVNITGSLELFQTYALHFASSCYVIPREELLT